MLATPRFWYRRRPTVLARLLQPCGWLYGLAVAWHRRCSTPVVLPVPVVSIGNLTLGGTGKTPLVIALARELASRGWRPAVLSRGYGSGRRIPLRVTPALPVAEVGDEARELASHLEGIGVWAGRDRLGSARQAMAAGADLLLLDDGLQHWRLARDCDVTVLDAVARLGNGLTFPAGPLREPAAALGRAQLLVLTGPAGTPAGLPWPAAKPWQAMPARLTLPRQLQQRPLLAFCGIGLPQKFFAALQQQDAHLVACRTFPDHHPYARADLERLLAEARDCENAILVTTGKDWQRLEALLRPGEADRIVPLPLQLEPDAVAALTDQVLQQLAIHG
jgi:tetraacyldisaccharide 4'-kinase